MSLPAACLFLNSGSMLRLVFLPTTPTHRRSWQLKFWEEVFFGRLIGVGSGLPSLQFPKSGMQSRADGWVYLLVIFGPLDSQGNRPPSTPLAASGWDHLKQP